MKDTWKQVEAGTRVVVAMSGGVDSSVAAALLAGRGCEVIGITMKNFCYSEVPEEHASAACCSLDAIEDARTVAREIGFVHHVLDFEGPFREAVMDPFVAEYAAGRTPNPCVRCNRFVRFPRLWQKARLLGAEAVATGHYARAARDGQGRIALLRPRDRGKDQTYNLWGLTGPLLERALFPLGGMTKGEVREKAEEAGLPIAEKPESQDICFVPDGDLAGFLGRRVAERSDGVAARRFEPGPIRTADGETVGEHPGSGFFTVGQRRGLGLEGRSVPHYVTAVGPDNTLVVGPEEELYREALEVEEANWIGDAPTEPFRAAAQIRSHAPAAPATVAPREGRRATVRFDEPRRAIAPGQSVVFYDGDRVAGGGTITRVLD